jgi:diadenylate cyclase
VNNDIQGIFPYLQSFTAGFDVLLVYFLIYRILLWLKRTHAFNLIKGCLLIFVIYLLSQLLSLTTLNWILGKFATVLIVIVIIIFQPEIRRFLERMGTTNYLVSPLLLQGEGQGTVLIKHILKSVEQLAKEKVGALIVLEASSNLAEYIESGLRIRGDISSDLLYSLFCTKVPTHDGAVIIRENVIEAAGCLLPLTDTVMSDGRLGTRHRAALALSELSDALIIVVSEENGVISLAENGNLTRYLTKEALETRLFNLYKETRTDEPRAGFKNMLKMFWRKSGS